MTIDAISGASGPSPVSPTPPTTSPSPPTAGSDGDGHCAGPSLSSPAQFLSKLRSLEQSDPAKAKQTLTDIASKLKADAAQATGAQADRLNQLADRFQKAADTGDLSSLSPDGLGKGGHHHHGHHKAQTAYQNGQGGSIMDVLNGVLAADTAAAPDSSTPAPPTTSVGG
jgi:hypothetical protein